MGLGPRLAVAQVMGLCLATLAGACGTTPKPGTGPGVAGASLLRSAQLPHLHRNIAWMGAARSFAVVESWLGLSAALRDAPQLSRAARTLGLASLDRASLAEVGLDATKPAGVVALEREHGTFATYLTVSDPGLVARAIVAAAKRARVVLQHTFVGSAQLWVPRDSPSYGFLLRGKHLFVIVTRGPKSLRDRSMVSLTAIDPSDALEADPTYKRATARLRSGDDVVFYATARGLLPEGPAQRGVVPHLLQRIHVLAIGAALGGRQVTLDAWAGLDPKHGSLLRARAKQGTTLVPGTTVGSLPLAVAAHLPRQQLLALLDAWWQSQGAPPIERIYNKLLGQSFASDWRPLVTGALTVATFPGKPAAAKPAAAKPAAAKPAGPDRTHLAIGITDEARARTLLAKMAARIPLLQATGRGASVTFSLQTDQNRRVPIVVEQGSLIITSAATTPRLVSTADTGAVHPSLRPVASHTDGGAVLVADAAHLAARLLPVDDKRARHILPVPAPGAPLSAPYKALIRELQVVYGTLTRAETQLAAVRRHTRAQLFGALGTLELVATPARHSVTATGRLRLRGASQALIHVALTATANADAAATRLQNHVAALTQRTDALRTRARLMRQRDVADYLLRQRLSKPPGTAPNSKAPSNTGK